MLCIFCLCISAHVSSEHCFNAHRLADFQNLSSGGPLLLFHIKHDSNSDNKRVQRSRCAIFGRCEFQSHTKARHNLHCPLMRINSIIVCSSALFWMLGIGPNLGNTWSEQESIFPLCISSIMFKITHLWFHLIQRTSPHRFWTYKYSYFEELTTNGGKKILY